MSTFKMRFSERDTAFRMRFGEVHNVSDGGYDRGFADGVASVPNYWERRINDTLTEYRDENAEAVNSYLFAGLQNLETVSFPSASEIKERAFYGCTNLKTVDAPYATEIKDYAFSKCTNLTTADFHNATSLGTNAFSQTGIVEAVFPNAENVEGGCFYNCVSLTKAVLPKLYYVYNSTFGGCLKLETVDLANAGVISSSTFYSDKNLQTLILRANSVCRLTASNAFNNTPIANGTGYIYVPAALVASYKAATNWSALESQFRAIEDYPEITGG